MSCKCYFCLNTFEQFSFEFLSFSHKCAVYHIYHAVVEYKIIGNAHYTGNMFSMGKQGMAYLLILGELIGYLWSSCD